MATGDLNGNLQRLLRELKAIKYPSDVDEVGLRLGDPVAFLPLLNFSLLKFSRHVARYIIRNGFELAGKTDHRFIESSFRLFRDVLNVRTVLTPAQFFEQGFAERKVLLLCDVIAVCKKLHNEEVRQERLAALKATRQEQVTNRLAAPRRASPSVKVIRNDDVEITTVLAPQHLPNSSDASQSVFKAKKTTAARSPSPSPSVRGPGRGKPLPRASSSPDVQRSTRKGESLELTFRPVAPTRAEQGPSQAPPAAPPSRGPPPAAPPVAPPPIRYWFMNPAFDGNEEGGTDLGVGTGFASGAEGRPDSSAWWLPSSSPPGQPSSGFWQQPEFTAAEDAYSRPSPTPDPGRGDEMTNAQSGKDLFFGAAPAAQAGGPAFLKRQVAAQVQQAQQLQRGPATSQQPAATGPMRHGAAGTATAAAGSRAASGGGALATRDLDEWSFSQFFGPGKVAAGGRAQGAERDQLNARHEAGTSDDEEQPGHQWDGAGAGASSGAVGDRGADTAHDDLQRDGRPAPDQYPDRRHDAPPAVPASDPRLGPPLWSVAAAQFGGQVQAPSHQGTAAQQSAAREAGGGPGAAVGSGSAVDWAAKLAQLERETQEQLQALQTKLAAAEADLDKTRTEAKQSRDVLQARVTVLEGRVRFLECELELCIKRQPGQEPAAASSPEQRLASPAPATMLPREPSLALPVPPGPSAAAATSSQGAAPARSTSPSSRYSPRHPAIVEVQQDARGSLAAATPLGQTGHRLALESTRVAAAPSAGAAAAPALRDSLSRSTALGAAAHASSGLQGGPVSSSFSPMPQPTFSFQPTRLMQQVASAAIGPGTNLAPGPQAALHTTAGPYGGPAVQAPRPYGSSLDSSAAALLQAAEGGALGQGNAHGIGPGGSVATVPIRYSLDSAAAGALATGHGPTVDSGSCGANGTYGAGRQAAERAGPRNGAGSSILDGVTGAQGRQLPGSLPAPPAALVPGQQAQRPGPGGHGGTAGGHAVAPAADAGSMGAGATTGYALPASGGPPSAGAGGAFRNTDDLISSLYLRYTEAQDFLQTLRKR